MAGIQLAVKSEQDTVMIPQHPDPGCDGTRSKQRSKDPCVFLTKSHVAITSRMLELCTDMWPAEPGGHGIPNLEPANR